MALRSYLQQLDINNNCKMTNIVFINNDYNMIIMNTHNNVVVLFLQNTKYGKISSAKSPDASHISPASNPRAESGLLGHGQSTSTSITIHECFHRVT